MRVLIDNKDNKRLCGEWGLSVWIEYKGKNILLDAGASEAFAANAEAMGIELQNADYAVLSHAHYDHADGLPEFFRQNRKCRLYLRAGAQENCYSLHEDGLKYIGMKKGMTEAYGDRFIYADSDMEIEPGVRLIGHHDPAVAEAGKRARMFVMRDGVLQPETFDHEQTLALDTPDGLVLFNSCCHGGADVIVREAEKVCGRPVYALIGGLHLFRSGGNEIRGMAERLKDTGVRYIITGHCTGEAAMNLLREVFEERLIEMYSGFTWSVNEA